MIPVPKKHLSQKNSEKSVISCPEDPNNFPQAIQGFDSNH